MQYSILDKKNEDDVSMFSRKRVKWIYFFYEFDVHSL